MDRTRKDMLWAGALILFTIFGGCSPNTKPFTIGMVNDVAIREPSLDGFKAGMAELGYIVRYLTQT
ncbi:MAG: hypothetical protein JW944_15230 [Deltaproteobacteria bacterium]|nr:hypothetical protein [Deltaproteobacteria bacterium]